jgi:hypothetical protein
VLPQECAERTVISPLRERKDHDEAYGAIHLDDAEPSAGGCDGVAFSCVSRLARPKRAPGTATSRAGRYPGSMRKVSIECSFWVDNSTTSRANITSSRFGRGRARAGVTDHKTVGHRRRNRLAHFGVAHFHSQWCAAGA